ncbi:predicted protein [Coccidioides posadasii str. Silveira]|uniref:Predicted protein n=1 Tax=Coccidioides posadasii (strain RMSCC 757 / Silveira) TaxID=443226 RepID=E9DE27_COCPS|nr:predicted protein [Coccidioides posadasii str. Silveira]
MNEMLQRRCQPFCVPPQHANGTPCQRQREIGVAAGGQGRKHLKGSQKSKGWEDWKIENVIARGIERTFHVAETWSRRRGEHEKDGRSRGGEKQERKEDEVRVPWREDGRPFYSRGEGRKHHTRNGRAKPDRATLDPTRAALDRAGGQA